MVAFESSTTLLAAGYCWWLRAAARAVLGGSTLCHQPVTSHQQSPASSLCLSVSLWWDDLNISTIKTFKIVVNYTLDSGKASVVTSRSVVQKELEVFTGLAIPSWTSRNMFACFFVN